MEKTYYRVMEVPRNIPPHYEYGYEDWYDFRKSLYQLEANYAGEIGECIGQRHAFLLLSISKDGADKTENVWIPKFLCQKAVPKLDNESLPDPYDELFNDW